MPVRRNDLSWHFINLEHRWPIASLHIYKIHTSCASKIDSRTGGPMRTSSMFWTLYTIFLVPLHSPNDRHLPVVKAVQRDCQWRLKNVGSSHRSREPAMQWGTGQSQPIFRPTSEKTVIDTSQLAVMSHTPVLLPPGYDCVAVYCPLDYLKVKHRGLNNMTDISQILFSNFDFVEWKSLGVICNSTDILGAQLIIRHHWFRHRLGAKRATSHYMKQCWLMCLTSYCVTAPQRVYTSCHHQFSN